ncbi:hypothetical protein EVG20_g799 [Dentipellis fragilis]|uniref:Uncharacterized protein n=1 Tax=Dentipellis fragilis TaxID=205917 RepID=A0A4Y9ZBQ3_9AGAM|nr:hypothetical protein EVG20_g799 [Dentipellis fragilis]
MLRHSEILWKTLGRGHRDVTRLMVARSPGHDVAPDDQVIPTRPWSTRNGVMSIPGYRQRRINTSLALLHFPQPTYTNILIQQTPSPTHIFIMTDAGRQSFTDKVSNAVKPDSQKTTSEHLGDKVTGKADSAASTAQPESQKSYTQKASDAVTGNKNDNSESLTGKAKHALGLGQGHK